MTRTLQLAAAFTLAAALAPAHAASAPRPQHEDVEWLWQYTPDKDTPLGQENELVQDLRFKPFLDQHLTAPQTFWGQPINGKYRTLADTALDHLTVPDKVLADDNRYISISGCTVHFCPARGLLWVDLGGPRDKASDHHLVVFAAIDWTKQGRPTSDPTAEYNLWVFPDDTLAVPGPDVSPAPKSAAGNRIPPALTSAIGRWAATPLAGSKIVQNITHAYLVDPDGTQHEVPPSALGVQPVMITVPTGASPAPGSHTGAPPSDDNTGPILKPRN